MLNFSQHFVDCCVLKELGDLLKGESRAWQALRCRELALISDSLGSRVRSKGLREQLERFDLSALCLRLANAHIPIILGKKVGVELKVGSTTQAANGPTFPILESGQHASLRVWQNQGPHTCTVGVTYSTADTLTHDEGVTQFRFGLRRRVPRPEKIYLTV